MFNSTLNGKSSAMVKTEVQEIEISSTIIPEKTVNVLFCYKSFMINIGFEIHFIFRIFLIMA